MNFGATPTPPTSLTSGSIDVMDTCAQETTGILTEVTDMAMHAVGIRGTNAPGAGKKSPYKPDFVRKCEECSFKIICNGCSDCGRCAN